MNSIGLLTNQSLPFTGVKGNVITSSGSYADYNPMRFSTKWFDTEQAVASQTGAIGETGLYYYGYRYYSPTLGRWINRDPIGELGGLNLYGFVRNNSITGFDSLGDRLSNMTKCGGRVHRRSKTYRVLRPQHAL